MAWDLGKLFATMKKGMLDDKGLFQGGEEGRMLGRAKDFIEGRTASYDPSMASDNELSVQAREFAKNMDVGNKDDVLEMQRMLNQLGFKDFEGNELTVDGMLGDKTLSALRMLQGGSDDEQQGPGPWSYGEPEVDIWGSSGKYASNRAFKNLFDLNKYTGPGSGDPLDPNLYKRKENKDIKRFKGKGSPGPWSDGSGY